jgi:uncharacterized protein (TIGR00255 family)
MGGCLLRSDEALAQKQLHVAVIARSLNHSATSQVIHAAVSDMRPPCRALLHDAHGACCPRPLLQRQTHAYTHDFLVRPAECEVQETQWVEDRVRRMPEGFQNRLLRNLGGTRAISMAAHAIYHENQGSVLGNRRDHPVLVFFASPYERDVSVLNPQEGTRASDKIGRALYHSRADQRKPHRAFRWWHAPEERHPMIVSMTGFARREATGPWGTLVCELRSVNHRFLETSFRLPDELRSIEPDLRQIAARELRRGKVDCTISRRAGQGANLALDIDREALERVLNRVRELAAAFPQSHTVNLMDVLRWPGVVREDATGSDELANAARQLFTEAVQDLVSARTREGARLAELIEQRCAGLETLVAQVRARLPEVRTRVRERLNERLAELKAQVDQDRLEQELALLLQRLDVDEELDRLTGHIEEIRRVTRAGEPAGRRLDFLMQELNREANTLSSKSQDLETTRAAVEMKVLIEQMREQVQNIE